MRAGALATAAITAFLPGGAGAALQITHVHHRPEIFDPGAGERVAIRFRLSEAARVALHVYDGRDLRVRTVSSDGEDSAGDHTLQWDGRDDRGRPVPPEAYRYTLAARNAANESVEWDLSDQTGGEVLRGIQVTWDAEAGVVRYALPKPARVNLRVGLQAGGPLLRTLANWVVRPAGAQAEPWDGRDASGVLELADHPKLALTLQAYAFSANTILVGPPPEAIHLIGDLGPDATRRIPKRDVPPRRFSPVARPLGSLRDVALEIAAVNPASTNGNGKPVVAGPVAFRVDVAEAERARLLAERFEVGFFVDGRPVFENEVGFLPMTWTWDPTGANPGAHVITANLWGFQGTMGTASVRVVVESKP
jgi:hypothetical protein